MGREDSAAGPDHMDHSIKIHRNLLQIENTNTDTNTNSNKSKKYNTKIHFAKILVRSIRSARLVRSVSRSGYSYIQIHNITGPGT